MTRYEKAIRLRGRIDALSVTIGRAVGARMEMASEEMAAMELAAIGSAPVPELMDGGVWEPGARAAAGRKALHNGKTYEALISHLTQAAWAPDIVPALWKQVKEELAPWYQPQGAHDAYMKGDRVIHLGRVWESTVDYNTWEPGVYGWTEV